MTKPAKTKPSQPVKKPTAEHQLPHQAGQAPPVGAALSPQTVDEATGAAALQRVKPLLAAVPPSEVAVLTLNLRMAALTALGIYRLIESQGLLRRLHVQAQVGELELAQLEQLPDLARATFYLRLQVEQASAVTSDALVPAALATHAQELRRRMLKLLGFHFDEDAKIGPKLEFIRRGTGYQDLAEDLIGLVKLYRAYEETLKQTTTHYRAGDAEDAANTAAELMTWLSGDAAGDPADPELLSASELASRAGLLLVRAYDEVAAACRYLCRRDPALAERFQSLYALTRSRASAASRDGSAGASGAEEAGSQPKA